MHEASIAQSILDTAFEECRKSGYEKIQSIEVKIGRASGCMPDALSFAFDALKQGTPANDAALIIEDILVGGRCLKCNKEFTGEELFVFSCPHCGASDIEVSRGRELNITGIEVI